MGGILGSLGIDPFYLFVILFVLQVAIIVLLCLVYDKYNRLQNSYNVFMKGKMERVWKNQSFAGLKS